jgi:hypothetical protein
LTAGESNEEKEEEENDWESESEFEQSGKKMSKNSGISWNNNSC